MTRHARTVSLVLLILFFAPVATAEDDVVEGWPIVTITFDRFDIFDTTDPKTKAWLYRWANALHIISKEDFLRSMLLFKEGDPYSESKAAESARILRSLGIMNPIEITARRVEGGVAVTVETHDRWSLQLGGQAGLFGSRSSFSLDIEDENFLGWGKSLGVAYESDEERSGWSFRYFDPNLFRSRWRLLLVHADLSDGSRDELRIDRPFYSLATRWSWGFEGRKEELTEHLYSQGDSVVAGGHETEFWRVWGGARLPGRSNIARRLIGGWVHRRDLYANWEWEDTGVWYPTPENIAIEGPNIGFEQIADRFLVVEGFRSWTVQEDVALGPNFSVASTISLPSFGGDRKRVPFGGSFHKAIQRNGWLFLCDAWLSGRLEENGGRNIHGGFQLGGAQLGPRGWQTRLLVEDSHELALDRQLTLGADIGLRGWNPDYFDGTGRALLNVQWRTLLKEEVLGLFSVGIVFFGDAGKTWDPRVGPDTDGVRFDAGIGLLIDLAHLSRTNLLRVDLALPDDGTGLTLTVTTSTIFRLRRQLNKY